jgi:hypothetical protein
MIFFNVQILWQKMTEPAPIPLYYKQKIIFVLFAAANNFARQLNPPNGSICIYKNETMGTKTCLTQLLYERHSEQITGLILRCVVVSLCDSACFWFVKTACIKYCKSVDRLNYLEEEGVTRLLKNPPSIHLNLKVERQSKALWLTPKNTPDPLKVGGVRANQLFVSAICPVLFQPL